MISGCMIVRDADATVGAALASLRPVCDEVVVLDTGSTDGTRERLGIIEANWHVTGGAKLMVHDWPWRDDFAAARNEVQDRAQGDWIVVLDADEVLREPGNLREAIEKAVPEIDGCVVRVECAGDGGVVDRVWQVRAYRKDRGRWTFPVHNQLFGIKRGAQTSARIWTSYVGGLARRFARSIPMLEKYFAEHPVELHAPYHLARMYAAIGRWEEALTWSERAIVRCVGDPGEESMWVIKAQAVHALRGLDAAETVLAEGIRAHPDAPDLRYLAIALAVARWADVASAARRNHRCDLTTERHLPASQEEWRKLQVALDDLDLRIELIPKQLDGSAQIP